MPYNASGIFAVSDGTFVYCGGGYDGITVHADFLFYDPVLNTWTALPPSPDQHYRSQAVYSNGNIYNMGGFGVSGVTNTTRIYDGAWTTGAPMPVALSDMATVLWNGIIYVAGGYNGSGAVITLYAYNIATNSWSTLAPMPQALYGPGFGAINGKLYIASGNNGTSELNTLYIYDIATNIWTTGANVPTAVTGPGSTVYCGKLYLYGGGIVPTLNITQIYDPTTDTWSSGPNLTFNRLWFYGSAVNNTSIVAPGGEAHPGIPINANEQMLDCPCGPTPTPTTTPTATPTGCSVTSSACGSIVVGTAPTDFPVNLSDSADPATVQGSDFTVNGTPADTAILSNGNTTITFVFNTSPAVQGQNTMHIAACAFNCGNGCVQEFTCTFTYQASTPTPTPTASSTPTSTPRPTPTPRPQPSVRPRPTPPPRP